MTRVFLLVVSIAVIAGALLYCVAPPPPSPVLGDVLPSAVHEPPNDRTDSGRSTVPPRETQGVVAPDPAGVAQDSQTGSDVSQAQLPDAPIPNPGLLFDCPSGVSARFATFRDLCRKRSVHVSKDLRMTLGEWSQLGEAIGRFEATVEALDRSRREVLRAIQEQKRAARDFEVHLHPGREPDPERKRALEVALADARRPRRPGEIVISGGNGVQRFIMRVDPRDYPELARLEESLERETAELVAKLSIAIAHRR